MASLAQSITKIPGLTGSSFQRQQQYWNKLGLGKGYTGSLQQNLKLLSYISKPNYGLVTGTVKAASAAKPAQSLAQQYAGSAGTAPNVPVFSEVMPFYKAWESLLPNFQQAAEAQINPGVQREYQQQSQQLANTLAGQGGGRLGAGLGGFGSLGAQLESSRKAQLQDWLNQQQQGFQTLFYNPSQEAYNTAITQGKTPTAPKIPTWDEYQKQYGGTAGVNNATNNAMANPIKMALNY